MKYRILTDEELSHFTEDFKQFLIVNSIHAEEWEKLNQTEPEKALNVVELFSDTVLQRVYEKIEFLELRKEDSCFVFQLEKNQMNLISIQRKSNASVDLSTPDLIQDALLNHLDDIEFFTSTKAYSAEREIELHNLIEQGCEISSQEFWAFLMEIISA